ncbi:SAM-dependent methyltransferase [Microbispora triticiradicis]|uniref:SAM-dependent methyltransferase n=1 Tax=Microbispora triticiradicis TaxID=2200763 RepID=UPI001FCDC185|nr:SAM-dependent methyltransferase [Microbispora triticiradicis]
MRNHPAERERVMTEQAPGGFDATRPNVARMYDYYLGGKNHFPADRAAAERVVELSQGHVREAVRENRAFLRRAVRFLARERGIGAFLDLGAGLPTQGNVHEIALDVSPDVRVTYVDNDPVVAAHARALLEGDPRVRFAQADLRRPEEVVAAAEANGFALDRPVALLLVSCLHFVRDDEDPEGLMAAYRELLPSGSHVVISHVTSDPLPDAMAAMGGVYSRANAPFEARPAGQIAGFFDGFDLVEPGVVELHRWRPEPDALPLSGPVLPVLGGVARRP